MNYGSLNKRILQKSNTVDRTPPPPLGLIDGSANQATALHLNRRHHSSYLDKTVRKWSDLVSFGRGRPALSSLLESLSPPKRNASSDELRNVEVMHGPSWGLTRGWTSQLCWSTVAAPPIQRWQFRL